MSAALKRKIQERLLELSPRAFEYFAGDLLEYLGLASVSVTRQTGDGGIDATCEMVSGNLFHVPAGVQVKRQRHSIARPEMDRFIGALSNRFACGIFITTAAFTRTSLSKAQSSVPHVSTIDGDQVAEIMVANSLGTRADAETLDEDYFSIYEAPAQLADRRAIYQVTPSGEIAPEDDLVSLRALSYALHVDTTTIRSWVERGLLAPDIMSREPGEGLFFRRHQIGEIREKFSLRQTPASREQWLEGFLHFAMQGKLNKSYKPVMLLAILDHIQPDGTVDEDTLVDAFWAFYKQRAAGGLLAEAPSSILSRPDQARRSEVRNLLIRYPLDRFIIQGHIQHLPEQRLIRLRSEVWEALAYRDVLQLRKALQQQIDGYYASIP